MAPIRYSIEYLDYCSGCNKKKVIQCCDKCGDAVCENPECCTMYPQYKKDDIVLCNYCIKQILLYKKLNKFPILGIPGEILFGRECRLKCEMDGDPSGVDIKKPPPN